MTQCQKRVKRLVTALGSALVARQGRLEGEGFACFDQIQISSNGARPTARGGGVSLSYLMFVLLPQLSVCSSCLFDQLSGVHKL